MAEVDYPDTFIRINGMNIYDPKVLVERKLNTIIGDRPRRKARDIYDTGWIVTQRPELLSNSSTAKLKGWMAEITCGAQAEAGAKSTRTGTNFRGGVTVRSGRSG